MLRYAARVVTLALILTLVADNWTTPRPSKVLLVTILTIVLILTSKGNTMTTNRPVLREALDPYVLPSKLDHVTTWVAEQLNAPEYAGVDTITIGAQFTRTGNPVNLGRILAVTK